MGLIIQNPNPNPNAIEIFFLKLFFDQFQIMRW
jgi:hypothetical protein